ncbi:helix-turn-helix transcriptional regulator [Clavibacter sp. Sh2036]|uniref:helix-turn-helix transcriptional regulator n=1 Tax=Clavibacter sp. Sh2036 TaxID=3397677 RepID=UPI0039DF4ADC
MRASWPSDLGLVARQRRLDLAWSQEELAAKAEVTRQWLTRFETGKGDPTLSKVLRVLRELELHVHVTPEERAAPRRPRVTIPVYEPVVLDASDLLSALEHRSRPASRMKAPDGKAVSSTSTAMHAEMAGALERLSRSQQQMRGQGQLPSGTRPGRGEDREDME